MGTKITPTRKSQAKWTSTAISFQGPMRKLLVCNFYSCKCIFDFGFLPIKLLIAEETERKTRRLVELLGADRVETFTEADFLKHIDRDQEALFVIILHLNHLDFFCSEKFDGFNPRETLYGGRTEAIRTMILMNTDTTGCISQYVDITSLLDLNCFYIDN